MSIWLLTYAEIVKNRGVAVVWNWLDGRDDRPRLSRRAITFLKLLDELALPVRQAAGNFHSDPY